MPLAVKASAVTKVDIFVQPDAEGCVLSVLGTSETAGMQVLLSRAGTFETLELHSSVLDHETYQT